MSELDIMERPSIIAPELLERDHFVVVLSGGNKRLDINFIPNIDSITPYIHGYRWKRAIPGMTTKLNVRAYEIMHLVVGMYGRDFRFIFSSENANMMAWAKDPDKGQRIFQWDSIMHDTATKFSAAKIIHPRAT